MENISLLSMRYQYFAKFEVLARNKLGLRALQAQQSLPDSIVGHDRTRKGCLGLFMCSIGRVSGVCGGGGIGTWRTFSSGYKLVVSVGFAALILRIELVAPILSSVVAEA